MQKILGKCPGCGEKMVIREYECPRCGIHIRGNFQPVENSGYLAPEIMELIKIFGSSYGNIGEVATRLGVSRPTAKARITDLGRVLGVRVSETGKEEQDTILAALESGEISVDDAIEKLTN